MDYSASKKERYNGISGEVADRNELAIADKRTWEEVRVGGRLRYRRHSNRAENLSSDLYGEIEEGGPRPVYIELWIFIGFARFLNAHRNL